MPKKTDPGKTRRSIVSAGARSSAGRAGKRISGAAGDSFTSALADLLRSRKIRVPTGLEDAPRHAYASQPASFVDELAGLGNKELRLYAEKIASYAQRQAERARQAWEASPLIAELRRRKLEEPSCPVRVVGASVSLSKPLSDWSDEEIVRAADEWSRMGQP
jgi:hypothetical protein